MAAAGKASPAEVRTGYSGGVGAIATVCGLAVSVALATGPAGLSPAPGGAPQGEPPSGPAPDRVEVALLPSGSYSTEMGFGVGLLASLAAYAPGYHPYRWKAQVTGFLSIRGGPGGAPEVPIYAGYFQIDLPDLTASGVRLNVRAILRQALADYYGLGNHTSDQVPVPAADGAAGPLDPARFFQYRRTWAALKVGVRAPLFEPLHTHLELSYSYNFILPFTGSKLERDARGDSGEFLAGALAGLVAHGVFAGRLGLTWDSRDQESAPESGMFHELTLHGAVGDDRIAFAGVQAVLRAYQALGTRHLVVAARLVADVIGGRQAFYDLPLLGSYSTVRGVPWRRFQGKGRIFGNLELRGRFLAFELLEQRLELGAVAFCDAGRVWAELAPHAELDGPGAGVKIGVGGGLRLHWGASFVIRADAAWSPDGHGIYIGGGHLF